MEAGVIAMHYSHFDIQQMVKDIINSQQENAEKQNVVVKTHFDSLRHVIKADKRRIKHVLINLIDNAIKYGHAPGQEGEVTVSLTTELKKVKVSIFDKGNGIAAADLPRIFDRFYRVEKSRARSLGGTGLGLAIVKQIVEAHGSQIDVESTVGEGTTFSFMLKKPKARVSENIEQMHKLQQQNNAETSETL